MEKLAVERSIWIDAPRGRVWLAVTDPEQIAQWFAPGTSFTQIDNRISVRFGDVDMEVAIIDIVDPPRQLTTRNLPDMTLTTTYLLEEENGGTRFTVIESGYESLPEDARQTRHDQDGVGWEAALQNLQAFIDGKSLPTPQGF
ncbi:MAG: SRPBCC domain-containing protein [Chloroflexota bacterium]